MRRHTSSPEMPGRPRSSTTRSGRRSREVVERLLAGRRPRTMCPRARGSSARPRRCAPRLRRRGCGRVRAWGHSTRRPRAAAGGRPSDRMHGTPKEVTLPNLKVYRAAWVVASRPHRRRPLHAGQRRHPQAQSPNRCRSTASRPRPTCAPSSSDFPQRVAGTDPDNRLALWVDAAVQAGRARDAHRQLPGHHQRQGRGPAERVGGLRGTHPAPSWSSPTATSPPLATQGANDNASGVAAMLELARAFTVTAHDHTIIFLCTSGDAYGALGARDASSRTTTIDDLYGVIALRDVATRDRRRHRPRRLEHRAQDGAAVAVAARGPGGPRDANLRGRAARRCPRRSLRLAVPTSSGSQGPFVAAGVPAITVTAAGPAAPPQSDTLDTVSHRDAHQDGHRRPEHADGHRRHHRARAPRAAARSSSRTSARCRAARSPLILAALLLPLARRHRRPVRPLPPGPRPPAPGLRARRPAPRAVAGADRHRLPRQPRRPAAPQPGRRHPARLPPRRHARATCAWPCCVALLRAGLRLRRRGRAAPASGASPRTRAPPSSWRTRCSCSSRCCCCS